MYQTTWQVFLEPQEKSLLKFREHIGTIHRKRGVYYTNGGALAYNFQDSNDFDDQIDQLFEKLNGIYTEEQIKNNCFIAIIES